MNGEINALCFQRDKNVVLRRDEKVVVFSEIRPNKVPFHKQFWNLKCYGNQEKNPTSMSQFFKFSSLSVPAGSANGDKANVNFFLYTYWIEVHH